MKKKLLVTDSYFVGDVAIEKLTVAGFEVTHLDKVEATEEELVEALSGVSVYILGGIEQVTDKVISAADSLEAIIFTGVDYDNFIPGAALAKKRGINLLNAPGANAVAVGEFAVGVALIMLRELFDLGRTGSKKEITTSTFQNSKVGIIGMGNIGQVIANAVTSFSPDEVIYFNRSNKDVNARQVQLNELVETSDFIFVTLPKSAGLVLDSERILKMKQGCLVVSISPMDLIDFDALLPRLQKGELRAAVDWSAPLPEYEELPLNTWFHVNGHSGFNTKPAIDAVEKSVVETAISLL